MLHWAWIPSFSPLAVHVGLHKSQFFNKDQNQLTAEKMKSIEAYKSTKELNISNVVIVFFVQPISWLAWMYCNLFHTYFLVW